MAKAMAKASEAASGGQEPADWGRAEGNLLHLMFSLAVIEAAGTLDLSAIARLLRDPSVPVSQSDREELAELLVPLQRGAKVKGKLVGRPGRKGTTDRDLAFYGALEAYRFDHQTNRIPAAAKAEIAARFGILDVETAKKAEAKGKRLWELERLGHWSSHVPPED